MQTAGFWEVAAMYLQVGLCPTFGIQKGCEWLHDWAMGFDPCFDGRFLPACLVGSGIVPAYHAGWKGMALVTEAGVLPSSALGGFLNRG